MQINLINVLTNTGQRYIESFFAYQILCISHSPPGRCITDYTGGQIMTVLYAMLITYGPVEIGLQTRQTYPDSLKLFYVLYVK